MSKTFQGLLKKRSGYQFATLAKVGRKPIDHLRHLVEITRLNEFKLHERAVNRLQDELAAIAQRAGYWESAYSVGLDNARALRLTRNQLRELIQEIRTGIRRCREGTGWVVSMDSLRRFVIRRKDLPAQGRKYIEGPFRSRVLAAVADLLDTEGTRLQVCRICKMVYVKQKRQQFCSLKCGQGERTKRYRTRRRREINKRRRANYRQKRRAELGLNVRVRKVVPRGSIRFHQ